MKREPKTIESVKVRRLDDDSPDLSLLGEQRMERYGNSWGMIGIRAEAMVRLGRGRFTTVTSGGLWGIESDSGDDYFAEVGREELNDLRATLSDMGFTPAAIDEAFADVDPAGGENR
jgi:hypothetical protein